MPRGNAAKHAQIPFHGRRETEQHDMSFTRHKHALLSDSAEIFVCFTQQATVSKSQRRGTICIFLLFDRFTGETTEKR